MDPWLEFALQTLTSGTIAAVVVAMLSHKLARRRDASMNELAKQRDKTLHELAMQRDAVSHKRRVISELRGFLETWKTAMQVSPGSKIYLAYNGKREDFTNHAGRVEAELATEIRTEFERVKNELKSYTGKQLHKEWSENLVPVGAPPDFEPARHEVIAKIDSIGKILDRAV